MKLCVFQGTFNPIHNAHIKMAQYLLKDFDKILFIPAFNPPQKEFDQDLAYHRLNMVKLATQDNPHFEVSDIEFKREGKSYTYLTIKELYKQYDIDDKINFIIGTDAYNNIDTWYKAEELKKLVNFIIFDRGERGNAGMEFVDISSTHIRKMIKNGKDIEKLVPQKVKEYIEKNGLYR